MDFSTFKSGSIINSGLDGIEVDHRDHTPDEKKELINLAKEFDLVISLGTFHNLHIYELEKAVSEVQRVGKAGYIMVESFRNELEMFNLECWALTAESIMDTDEWLWAYKTFGYTGDYEFIYFE